MRLGLRLVLFCLLPSVVLAETPQLIPKNSRPLRATTMEEQFPEGTDPSPRGDSVDVSTVTDADSAVIDLRPPGIPLGDFGIAEEPSWLDELIDDQLLIWKEVPIGTQILPRAGTEFGMTTLGIKFDVVGQGPLWVTGTFGWNFLSGPGTADVPPQTYDLGMELNYAKKISDQWGLHLNIAPLMATDFDNTSSDSFRLQAGGLLSFQADEVTKLVAGLTFLDRPDLNFLPIAGLRWMVTENLQLDMLVPSPRISWRFGKEEMQEKWLFFGGEVGGGSWAIEREANRNDRMGYRDLRCVGGIEYKQISGSRSVFEAGYVFNRKIEFQRGPGDVDPGSTFVIRWGQYY